MTLPARPAVPGLSGERFQVKYQITGGEDEARSLAETARVEQSVEFPAELVPDGDIRDRIMGQLEAFEQTGDRHYLATISFAVETAGEELTQLLNLMWGTGIFSGFRVERIELPPSLLAHYRGPRFGVAGLRARVKVHDRPLFCTAIKPLGLTPQHLAHMAYACALGGMDLIAERREQPAQFCVRAAEICGEHGRAAAARLDEKLANELPPQPGIPSLLTDPTLVCELRLTSDYPAVWLLAALARSGLAGAFSATELSYVADSGGFSQLFDNLIAHRVISPGHTLWVDYHSPRTSEALRKGVDAAIFVDARRLRRDLALWRLMPLPA